MSAPKWTPGPWEYRTDGDRHYVGCGVCCIVDETFATRETKDRGAKERQANARLIAAAPKLYGALDRLANEAQGFLAMADRESHGNTNIAVMRDRIREAFDVLAEARGEDQQPDDGRDGRDDLDDRDPMQIAAERCPPRE